MTPHLLNGTLSLDEDNQDRMNYIITNLSDGKQISISDILDTIYNGKNSIIKLTRVLGRVYNSDHTFTGFESLHIRKDKSGILAYHIGNFNLDKELYELSERNAMIEILVEDYTDSTKGMFTDALDTTEDNVNDNKSRIS